MNARGEIDGLSEFSCSIAVVDYGWLTLASDEAERACNSHLRTSRCRFRSVLARDRRPLRLHESEAHPMARGAQYLRPSRQGSPYPPSAAACTRTGHRRTL